MPDPAYYVQVMAVAAGVSALITLALGRLRPPVSRYRGEVAGVLGVFAGMIAGYYLLGFRPAWPPVSAIDRLLLAVFGSVIGIEVLACVPHVPQWLAWCLRVGLAAITARILLHGSVYLGGTTVGWSAWEAAATFIFAAVLLATTWSGLISLANRSEGTSIALALAQTLVAAGVLIMLEGYLTGGEATLPIAAALAGMALVSCRNSCRSNGAGAIGIGVVGLFSLLFIGRYFGRLSTASALTVFLAPFCCWVTEIPQLRHRKPWVVTAIRLALTALPLVVVLAIAKREFDRETAPLLGTSDHRDCLPSGLFCHSLPEQCQALGNRDARVGLPFKLQRNVSRIFVLAQHGHDSRIIQIEGVP